MISWFKIEDPRTKNKGLQIQNLVFSKSSKLCSPKFIILKNVSTFHFNSQQPFPKALTLKSRSHQSPVDPRIPLFAKPLLRPKPDNFHIPIDSPKKRRSQKKQQHPAEQRVTFRRKAFRHLHKGPSRPEERTQPVS